MRDKLLDWTPRFVAQALAVAGWLIGAVLLAMAYAVAIAVHMLVVVFLRLLRPFIMWPLTLAMIGGVLMSAFFAASGMWHDAFKAGFAAIVAAMVWGVYSMLVLLIDPEHFDDPVVIVRRWYN